MTDTTLLDAVDALTVRWSIRVHQPATAEKPAKTTVVRHRPRLRMLADAIHQSTNRDGGGSLARERSPIDATAAQMLADITRRIHDMARALDVAPAGPIETLRAWYVATQAKVLPEAWEHAAITELQRWADDIDAHLNPPQQVTIETPCPSCDAAFFTDRDGDQKPWPLRARMWDIDQHGHDRADATCCVCGATWNGLHEIRALAYDLEARDTPGRDDAYNAV